MATPAEENHAARKDATTGLGELKEKLDQLQPDNTNSNELPQGGSPNERLDNLHDELEEEIDKAHEAINANRIVEADKALRRLRRRIKRVVTDVNLARELLDLIKAVEKAKSRITEPPVPVALMQPGIPIGGVFVSEEDAVALSALEVSKVELAKLNLPWDRLKLVHNFGLRTVGDLVGWTKSRLST